MRTRGGRGSLLEILCTCNAFNTMVQRLAKRHGCLLSYSQAELRRELTPFSRALYIMYEMNNHHNGVALHNWIYLDCRVFNLYIAMKEDIISWTMRWIRSRRTRVCPSLLQLKRVAVLGYNMREWPSSNTHDPPPGTNGAGADTTDTAAARSPPGRSLALALFRKMGDMGPGTRFQDWSYGLTWNEITGTHINLILVDYNYRPFWTSSLVTYISSQRPPPPLWHKCLQL